MSDEFDTTALLLPPGPVDLAAIGTDTSPGFSGKKKDGHKALSRIGTELADLQERLFAVRSTDSERRILLVLQGMDTSGKGGTLRHTVGLVDPQGVRITSFKAPTDEEKKHDFLWRIRNAVPPPGTIGVFDRSHYEDVLIVKVHEWADAAEIEGRYDEINAFERELADTGTTIIKCMLHLGVDEQKARLQERLDNPEKHWKYNPGDVDERAHWSAYQEAYEIALERTHTEVAPWHVIPADKKWFRNLAVGHLLLQGLRRLDLQWPAADFDVEVEKGRLAESDPTR